MPNRGRPSIELPLDRAVALVSKIGIEAAAEELGVSRYTLRRKLNAAGFTNRRPTHVGRKKTKFTAEKCDPPHSCFECPFPDCIRPTGSGGAPTDGELAFAAVIKENSKRVQT